MGLEKRRPRSEDSAQKFNSDQGGKKSGNRAETATKRGRRIKRHTKTCGKTKDRKPTLTAFPTMSPMERCPRRAWWPPFSKVPTAGRYPFLESRRINLPYSVKGCFSSPSCTNVCTKIPLCPLKSPYCCVSQLSQEEVSCLLGLHTAL